MAEFLFQPSRAAVVRVLALRLLYSPRRLMWQPHQWNGQEAAFKFYMAILGVLIFLNQPDTD